MNVIRETEARDDEARESRPEDPLRERRRRRTARLLGLGALLVLAGMVGYGAWGHVERAADAASALQAQTSAVPLVRVMPAKAVTGARTVELPGNLQAFDAATLFARATGYIAERRVDIGSHVHKGDVLAVIAAPDLDQQLAQARAQLNQMQAALVQAQSNLDLAKVTNARTSQLVQQGWDSKQNGDQTRLNFAAQVAAVGVARANVDAQQAQVRRLEELTGFEQITAPFDGVITARQIDTGSLVTADAASGSLLFSIVRDDVLRVQIYVPQEYYFGLKDGQGATVTVPELPGREFHGRVARNASALAAGTRTLLTEVDVDNKDGVLTAGLYGIVHLQEPRVHPVVVIRPRPSSSTKTGFRRPCSRTGTCASAISTSKRIMAPRSKSGTG